MNHTLSCYVIACIFNAEEMPTPATICSYLIEPLKGIESRPMMHYRMMANIEEAVRENRALDALNIFNLIWWDMTESNAQRIFDLVKDMECDPDDDMGSYTVMHLSHTILGKFHVLT